MASLRYKILAMVHGIGPVLRRHRQRLHLSVDQVATLSGISRSHLYKVEAGDVVPTVDVIAAVELALGLRPGRLMADAAAEVAV